MPDQWKAVFQLCCLALAEAAPARIAIYGSCAARADVDAEYNLQGETASGAPLYKAVASDLHIYFDPSCDGTTTDSRWIISHLSGTPDRSLANDLDGDAACNAVAYISSTSTVAPPQGSTWTMDCGGSTQSVELAIEEVDRSGQQIAPAFFCAYSCEDRGKVTRPGRCFEKTEVFSTRGVSWMRLATRMSEIPEGAGVNIVPLTEEWATYSAGDMTWEGWFHVKAAPAAGRSMLIGTFGTNDADNTFSNQNRRRHGAIWLETDGTLGLSSNTGESSGYIQGPNVIDGKWHHVAAIWNQTAGGGAQLYKSFKFLHVRYLTIAGRAAILEDFIINLKAAMAVESNTTSDDVWVYLSDEQVIGNEGRTAVSMVVNVERKSADIALARLVRSDTFEARMMNALRITTDIANSYTGLLPVENNQLIYDSMFPTMAYVGSGRLLVDSIDYAGRLTYSPLAENIADNGQFLVGGGHQGRAVECELANVRLWSVALTEEQLRAVQACSLPEPTSFIGGSWPHSLHAAWAFNGHFINSFGPLENLTEESAWEEQLGTGFNSADGMNYPYWKNLLTGQAVQSYTNAMDHHLSRLNGGDFIRGGLCDFSACPAISPETLCPLERSVAFFSTDECEAFASFNYCRQAGSTRNRPSMPHLDGCHLGT